MRNLEQTLPKMIKLAEMGVGISIDDFGTGYSSLNYLKKLPIQKLKIDKSFIRDLASDSDDGAIVGAVIVMARKLNMKVIAEGVETEEQLKYLRSLGCDEMQGYLFSKPLPADEFKEFMAAQSGVKQPLSLAADSHTNNNVLTSRRSERQERKDRIHEKVGREK